MEIKSTLTNRSGQVLDVIYREGDPSLNIGNAILSAVHGICFYEDKMVIVYSEEKGYWSPPGGGIEPRESISEAVIREVMEETNMQVTYQEIIGYQDINELNKIVRQTRSFCLVEPVGKFIQDPDGDITEIKLIDPKDYKKYFNWGIIGDRIIERALEFKNRINK